MDIKTMLTQGRATKVPLHKPGGKNGDNGTLLFVVCQCFSRVDDLQKLCAHAGMYLCLYLSISLPLPFLNPSLCHLLNMFV
jgi:hypothetical protein